MLSFKNMPIQMKRALKPGDTVYTPCMSFNSGELWLEERKVREIGNDYIILLHVATLKRNDGQISRIECRPTEHKGDKKEIEYYSRPFEEIMNEFREENRWFGERMREDAEKYN
jgi:hypothetical protein